MIPIECVKLKDLKKQYDVFSKRLEKLKTKHRTVSQLDIIDEIIEEFNTQYYLDEFVQFE